MSWQKLFSLVLLLPLLLSAGAAYGKVFHVAYFAASSQNSFNQAVYQGVQEKAAEIGNVETTIFDGRFDAQIQYNQIEDAIAAERFDAFVILPNDTVGISSVVEEAVKHKIKVIAAFFPIGPDLNTLEPQVEGLTATIGRPPANGARMQAEAVAEFCRDKNPCNVVAMIGQKIFPFDNLRYRTYLEAFAKHENIQVIATVEGNYSPDVSLAAMQDVLQMGKKVHAIISNADQHIVGAEIALEDAGYNKREIFLVGSGSSRRSVPKVRSGDWDGTLVNLPKSIGSIAVEQAVRALEGEPVQTVINMDNLSGFPVLLTTENCSQVKDFEGEWE